MASIIRSIGISGLDGYLVHVEVSVYGGAATTSIVGLGDTAVKEAKDRIETCINQLDLTYPKKKIVINLSPGEVKKSGTTFDLAMVIGILLESNQISPEDFPLNEYLFLGEIGLGGELKHFKGVLPMVIAAKRLGYKKIMLPDACLLEATLVQGMEFYSFDSLSEVLAFMENRITRRPDKPKKHYGIKNKFSLDFSEVLGHRDIMQYIVAAIAGNHNLLMIGPPGCGKSMIAKRMPSILPDMTEDEVLEVTSIYSISGLLKENRLMLQRPFRAPHYNASANALIGGGLNALPGEISLAHNGILFLDEFPEFRRATLEALRQPLEDKVVTISRVRQTNTFPADFQLVAAMNPCPCGHYGSDQCHCSLYDIKRYTRRISGPILDRIDIHKYMAKVNPLDCGETGRNPTSSELRERIKIARDMQNRRFGGITGIKNNSQMEASHIKEFCILPENCTEILQRSYDKYQFSARTYNKIIKIARTFADLDSNENIGKKHLIQALMARDLDKEKTTLLVKNDETVLHMASGIKGITPAP